MTTSVRNFPTDELSDLRRDLLRSGLDYRQAAELLGSFLSAQGYGVSSQDAFLAASRIESVGCSLKCLQEELAQLAFVM